MSDFSRETQGNGNYLVYKFGENDVIDSMCLGQITNNAISGIAPASFFQSDSDRYIKYNVTSKVSVTQLLSGIVGCKRFLGILNGIVDGFISAEEYAIDISMIKLEKDYVFSDVATFDTVLICVPVSNTVNTANANDVLYDFIKDIIWNTQFDESENLDYVTELIAFINIKQAFSIDGLKRTLQKIEDSSNVASVKPNTANANKTVSTRPNNNTVQSRGNSAPATTIIRQEGAATSVMNRQPVIQTPSNVPPKPEQKKPQEKPMSWFYLMCHYSKENKEKYNAQKSNTGAVSTDKSKKQKSSGNDYGVNIPGMDNSSPVNIPVQGGREQTADRPSNPSFVNQTPNNAPVVQQPIPSRSVANNRGAKLNFGETTVLGGKTYGETTVLSQTDNAPRINPCLIRSRNNERIPLNKSPFKIGTEKSYVDYCISDNPAISHSHASISRRNDEFFVVDTNSTNHTYVDGSMIQSDTEIKIENGTKIRFADEEFEFIMY